MTQNGHEGPGKEPGPFCVRVTGITASNEDFGGSPVQIVTALRCWRRPSFTCSIAASVEGTWRSAFSSTKS